jgi:hypothetical protein
MLRAFSGHCEHKAGLSETRLLTLKTEYRRMVEAIRCGDLTEAAAAFRCIRLEQNGDRTLTSDAQLAFDALGDAIESGSLADATDGLRLLRLVLETSRSNGRRFASEAADSIEERPAETLRSGVVPAFTAAATDELPETATLQDIDLVGWRR